MNNNIDRSNVNSKFRIFFFEKSNKIKFNKMRQNFPKKKMNEIFKNEIFVDKKYFKCIINCLALLVNARTMYIH